MSPLGGQAGLPACNRPTSPDALKRARPVATGAGGETPPTTQSERYVIVLYEFGRQRNGNRSNAADAMGAKAPGVSQADRSLLKPCDGR